MQLSVKFNRKYVGPVRQTKQVGNILPGLWGWTTVEERYTKIINGFTDLAKLAYNSLKLF